MANGTNIAVGCAVGIPCVLAICIALYFFVKTRKRLEREDLEFQKDEDIHQINQDLHYDNFEQLKKEAPVTPRLTTQFDNSDTSDDGKIISEKEESSPKRFVPAYRKKMKSSMNLSNSRSSSLSNLPVEQQQQQQQQGSNSSINSSKTNLTDAFYQDVPVLDQNDNQVESATNSIDLARSLQMPTPSFTKKPLNRSSSTSSMDEYDLKNNYNMANQDEIQEEDQYENEFTNYSENKRAFIEGLRPKRDQ